MRKKKTALVVALLLIGVTALGLGAAVYAKYIASLQASGSASIAKWDFEGENTDAEFECDLTSTVVSGALSNDVIAPGTSGECVISLANTHSEVAVDYTIKANEDDSSNIPENLELSVDGTTYGSWADLEKTGYLTAGASATNVTVYWRWPYETGAVSNGIAAGDDDDTDSGEAAYAGSNQMTITFDVTGVQHNPAVSF